MYFPECSDLERKSLHHSCPLVINHLGVTGISDDSQSGNGLPSGYPPHFGSGYVPRVVLEENSTSNFVGAVQRPQDASSPGFTCNISPQILSNIRLSSQLSRPYVVSTQIRSGSLSSHVARKGVKACAHPCCNSEHLNATQSSHNEQAQRLPSMNNGSLYHYKKYESNVYVYSKLPHVRLCIT